jgi:undecaprenyl-diphosphatase
MEVIEAIDQGTLHALRPPPHSWLNPIMVGLTHLGDRNVLLGVVLFAFVCFVLLGRFRRAVIVLAIPVAAYYVGEWVKEMVNRPRPDVIWALVPVSHSSGSFPSNHSLGSMAAFLTIALAVNRELPGRPVLRIVLPAVAVLLSMLIGFTRMYVGAHYLSDVVAGWACGLSMALLGVWLMEMLGDRPREEPKPAKP